MAAKKYSHLTPADRADALAAHLATAERDHLALTLDRERLAAQGGDVAEVDHRLSALEASIDKATAELAKIPKG